VQIIQGALICTSLEKLPYEAKTFLQLCLYLVVHVSSEVELKRFALREFPGLSASAASLLYKTISRAK
jgi:hypothetical protein